MITETTFIDLSYKEKGAEISLAPEALKQKQNALAALDQITEVTNLNQLAIASNMVAIAMGLEKKIELTRKEVKRPVLDLGELIDVTAKNYIATVTVAKERVLALVNSFNKKEAARVAEENRVREAAEAKRLAELEAIRRKEEAEAAERERLRLAEIAENNRIAAEATEAARIAALPKSELLTDSEKTVLRDVLPFIQGEPTIGISQLQRKFDIGLKDALSIIAFLQVSCLIEKKDDGLGWNVLSSAKFKTFEDLIGAEDPALLALRTAAAEEEAAKIEKNRQNAERLLRDEQEAQRMLEEAERLGVEAARTAVSTPLVIAPPKVKGMSTQKPWKFTVQDPVAFYKVHPELCKIELMPSAINQAIKDGLRESPGITIYQDDVTRIKAAV